MMQFACRNVLISAIYQRQPSFPLKSPDLIKTHILSYYVSKFGLLIQYNVSMKTFRIEILIKNVVWPNFTIAKFGGGYVMTSGFMSCPHLVKLSTQNPMLENLPKSTCDERLSLTCKMLNLTNKIAALNCGMFYTCQMCRKSQYHISHYANPWCSETIAWK